MPIKVHCPCGKVLAFKDTSGGKTAKCPGCGATVQVPLLADEPAPAAPRPAKPAGAGGAPKAGAGKGPPKAAPKKRPLVDSPLLLEEPEPRPDPAPGPDEAPPPDLPGLPRDFARSPRSRPAPSGGSGGFPVKTAAALTVLGVIGFFGYRWISARLSGGVDTSPWARAFQECRFDDAIAAAGNDSPPPGVADRRKKQAEWEKKRSTTPMPKLEEKRAFSVELKDKVIDNTRGTTMVILIEIRNTGTTPVAFDPACFYVRTRPSDVHPTDDAVRILFARKVEGVGLPAATLGAGEGVKGGMVFDSQPPTVAMDLIYNDGDTYSCDLIGTEASLRQASLGKLGPEWSGQK